jgi:transcriptional regulator with XRE-family HTH domain
MASSKDTLRQRLRESLDAAGKSRHALSVEIGASPGYVRDLLDPEKTSMPSADKLQALAQALGTTTDWLLGKAETAARPVSEVTFREAPRPWRDSGLDGIPVRGTAFCDDLAIDGEDGEQYQVERVLLETDHTVQMITRPPALWAARDAYAIYLHGSSMEPRFYAGELAVVDPRRPPSPGDDVVVQLNDGNGGSDVITVLVKQLVRATGSYVELRQFNPAQTFRIPRGQVARLHRIVSNAELFAS